RPSRARRRGFRPAPVVLEGGRRLWFCTNATTRRQAGFRRSLVALLQLLHTDITRGMVVGAGAAAAAAEAAAPKPEGQEASQHQPPPTTAPTTAPANTMPSPPTAATTCTSPPTAALPPERAPSLPPPPPAAPWDPLSRRCWHPAFAALLAADRISPAQLRSAAAQMRAASRERGGEEQHQAQGGAGGGGLLGTACRPAGLLKRHESCMSCAALSPGGLLRHLQELPWYRGQVVHEEV
ncbi:hypothetical protein Agub_g1292, partial [Astrephomene gubernaculifera]